MGVVSWISHLMDATTLLQSMGPWVAVGIVVMVFIESGMLFPFLPGDSLLVTAAILRVPLGLSVWEILLLAAVAAVAGDQVGFWLGRRFGRSFFTPDARILTTRRLQEAEGFFHRHGPLALVLARFVPVVRTYVPLVAGSAAMPYRQFATWNVTGALAWVVSMTTVGVVLGGIPGIAHSIEAIMLVLVALSLVPLAATRLRRRAAV